ncbi:hypothetical protein FUAX_54860 (plasmid) [Fulvitalea axinellae]|uniref:Uncharacterized protein n=1 Tax=Fulvitalea axinellae TaxID=1182444 RepID=A0AAU9DF26_9BACT|nr:hypothetical protein FUAX_54860 [Fulvitalea axinellae]
MIDLIKTEVLDQAISDDDLQAYSNSSIHGAADVYYKYFLILEYFGYKIDNTALEVYYNKYYWFLRHLVQMQNLQGYDAGLEQQEFIILEEGESYDDINWDIVESISNNLKT